MIVSDFYKYSFGHKKNDGGWLLLTALLSFLLLCFAGPSLSFPAPSKSKPVISHFKHHLPHYGAGLASWYSMRDRHIKRYTASGEIFNDKHRTCAARNYKFGTKLKIVNTTNGKYVVCRVNDRGPSLKYKRRVVDLSKSAFRKIADTKDGLIPVSVIPMESNSRNF